MTGTSISPRCRHAGFTLLELIVSICVLAILAAIAAPSLGTLLERQRAVAATNALVTHLSLARLTAITHNSHTVFCPSTSGTGCDAGTDWSGGWMLFLDRDGNRRPDSADDIVRVERTALSQHLRLTSSAGRVQARYLPDGRSAGSNLTISVCNKRGELLNTVVVNNVGRIRSTRATPSSPCPRQT